MDSEQASFEKAKLVWDEYKYRHELCWKLLFQLTIAVVIVSLVPYTYPIIVKPLGYSIIILPVIGLGITWISLRRMKTEIILWTKIKEKHNELQTVLEIIKHGIDETRSFGKDILGYLKVLFGLGVINILVLIILWIWV